MQIPEAAEPWDSGYLVEPGDWFEVTLNVPGVYHYVGASHEMAGMVGRIMIGEPIGPGALPFDDFLQNAAARRWQSVPAAARTAVPSVETIMTERVVRRSPPGVALNWRPNRAAAGA